MGILMGILGSSLDYSSCGAGFRAIGLGVHGIQDL